MGLSNPIQTAEQSNPNRLPPGGFGYLLARAALAFLLCPFFPVPGSSHDCSCHDSE